MTIDAVKTCCLKRRKYVFASGVSKILSLFIMLCGCTTTGFNAGSVTWKTYNNYRYGFEFPYPSNWISLPAPENDDGIAFVSPHHNSVVIRGWASHQIPDTNTDQEGEINSNFRTTQGISGVLVVEVNQQISSMTLTLTQGQVQYQWQGQSQSQEFQDYYRLFYYIAQQYRIPKS
ncbi:hypothetical protein FNW02_14050 [Komarekiella sp. 'clone 1']|uniref:Uncharacterized protein n=1 Tax=Komarekiella delphini-convector SJRDD-AB1 TaxID=2593771 RepID=A0AA40VS25_9NOST|nr:hypothetical protein [Komarekiella delphini-convector]MBD6616921.1 hypothetical protein [Komarekiella delphini-convector SJRDD-AB1]